MDDRKYQRSPRFTRRLEAIFSFGGLKFSGISSDLSESGLFIRTRHGLTPGSRLDIEVYLPEGKICRIKGIVRRTVKTSLSALKNGMGIEIIEKDQNYLDFVKTLNTKYTEKQEPEAETQKSEGTTAQSPEAIIVTCPNCKVKNRIPEQKLTRGAKCGKCGAVLNIRDIT